MGANTATKSKHATRLVEFVSSGGMNLSVDRENAVVRGVKILGLESRNGRTYAPSAVRAAAGLYEGAKVNLDHPTGKPDSPRSYADRFAHLAGVTYKEGQGLFGDLHYNPKHALAEQFAYDAEHAPQRVGLSHNVRARLQRGTTAKNPIVEFIDGVLSVDLVADPATTNSLYESEGDETMSLESITLEQLKAERPDLIEVVIKEQMDAGVCESKLKSMEDELDKMKAEKSMRMASEAIDAELAAAKLPAALVTEVFRGTLLEAKDAAARKVLIEDRQSIARAASFTRPTSKEQRLAEGGSDEPRMTTESFVASLRR